MRRIEYRSIHEELKKEFGGKVYKIALSTPFSCPNRDGTLDTGGCIFCSAKGSGNFAADPTLSVAQQLAEGKKRVAAKMKNEATPRYVAYFQAFSSTWGDVALQRSLFTQAISDPEVVALSVATRPDCLPTAVMELLCELNRIKPVWVELGLQTAKEETARLIHRCYENEVFTEAVERLHRVGIRVVCHLIVGLPHETHEDELASLAFAVRHPIWGIKFHLLHVLRDTPLAQMPYEPLTMEDYVARVVDLVRHTPPEIVIHRLTGDGDKKELLAPLWSADKKKVLNALTRALREGNVHQGEAFL